MTSKHFHDGTPVEVQGWPVHGTAVLTCTGFSSSPTLSVRYMVLGHAVFLSGDGVSGTSNAVVLQFSALPVDIRPTADRAAAVAVRNNGKVGPGTMVVHAAGTIDIFAGPPSEPFEDKGPKALGAFEVTYLR